MTHYFVSAENTAYHHWQLELLIESFKYHRIADSLTIALAENNNPIYVDYSHNLTSHPHVFTHENVGRKNNYLPYNRIYSLCTALEQKLFQQPFVLLHPDMVLVQNIEISDFNIGFQMDSSFQQPKAINNFVQAIQEAKKIEKLDWIPLGDTMMFNNVPMDFFRRVLQLTDLLTKQEYFDAEKVAWALTLLEYTGHLRYYGSYELENILLDEKLRHVIHYKHGLPPVFNKRMFSFLPPDVMGMGNPYEILLEHNPTVVTNYLQRVLNRCVRNDKVLEKPNSSVPIVQVMEHR